MHAVSLVRGRKYAIWVYVTIRYWQIIMSPQPYDPLSSVDGGNADGFQIAFTPPGGTNAIHRCRAWNNSDDGYDFYHNEGSIIVTGSWAFDNKQHGFNENFANMNIMLLNNIALYDECLENFSSCLEVNDGADIEYNSWNDGFSVSTKDFASLDRRGVDAPRNSDGSLRKIDFLRLNPKSSLVDAGVDVGSQYYGAAPDFGPFESGSTEIPVSKGIQISSFDTPDEWNAGTVDKSLVHEGSGSLLWNHGQHASTLFNGDYPLDLSDGDFFGVWVHNNLPVSDDGFVIVFYSTGGDYYMRVRTDHNGWRRVVMPKSVFTTNQNPAGWDQITRIRAYATGWSNTLNPDRTIHLDDLRLLQFPSDDLFKETAGYDCCASRHRACERYCP